MGVAVDSQGDVFVADTKHSNLTEIPAGGGPQKVLLNGTDLDFPFGVAVDGAGDLFVADTLNDRVLELPASGGGPVTIPGEALFDPLDVAVPPPTAQEISFTSTPPGNAAAGGTYDVTATGGGSGQRVAFSIDASSTPGACSLSGATVSFTGLGTCVVDANQAGTPSVWPAAPAVQTISIGLPPIPLASQTVTITSAPQSGATPGNDRIVWASGGLSGNPVTFSVDPKKHPVGVHGGRLRTRPTGYGFFAATVTFSGRGTCVLDANQAGNADFAAAAQVSQSFFVQLVPPVNVYSTIPDRPEVIEVPSGGGRTRPALATALRVPRLWRSDAAGDVFVADTETSQIDEVSPSGVQTTVPDPGVRGPVGLALDNHGDLFVASAFSNQVFEIPLGGGGTDSVVPATGLNDRTAGSRSTQPGTSTSRTPATAGWIESHPRWRAVHRGDGAEQPVGPGARRSGDLYIADSLVGDVVKVTPSGAQSTVVSNLVGPDGLAFDADGDLYVGQSNSSGNGGSITEFAVAGNVGGVIATVTPFGPPSGVAVASGQAITFTSVPPDPGVVRDHLLRRRHRWRIRQPGHVQHHQPQGVRGERLDRPFRRDRGVRHRRQPGTRRRLRGRHPGRADRHRGCHSGGGLGVGIADLRIVDAAVHLPGRPPSWGHGVGAGEVHRRVWRHPHRLDAASRDLHDRRLDLFGADAVRQDRFQPRLQRARPDGFSVSQASQTITFTSERAGTRSGRRRHIHSVGDRGGSGNPVTFGSANPAVCTLTGATVSFVGTGTCALEAHQAGNDNYDPAAEASQSFPVRKGFQTITFTSTPPAWRRRRWQQLYGRPATGVRRASLSPSARPRPRCAP